VQRPDLFLELWKREASIQYIVGAAAFVCERHLALDPPKGFGAGEAVALLKAGDLGFTISDHDDGCVNACVDIGFEEQGNVVDHNCRGIFPGSLFSQPDLLACNTGVNDALKLAQLAGMSKDFSSQGLAIKGAIRVEDGFTECSYNFPPGRFAWLDDFPRKRVGIDNRGAVSLEHAGDGAFPGGDAACESDQDHGGGAYHGGESLTTKPVDRLPRPPVIPSACVI